MYCKVKQFHGGILHTQSMGLEMLNRSDYVSLSDPSILGPESIDENAFVGSLGSLAEGETALFTSMVGGDVAVPPGRMYSAREPCVLPDTTMASSESTSTGVRGMVSSNMSTRGDRPRITPRRRFNLAEGPLSMMNNG